MQTFPSTTETESAVTERGAKFSASLEAMNEIFTSTFPASFNPIV